MATMYRRGGDGNWGNNTLWSDTEGGAANGNAPDSTTDVIFGAASVGTTTTIPNTNPAEANSVMSSSGVATITSSGAGGTLTLHGSSFTGSNFNDLVLSGLELVLGGSSFPNLRANNPIGSLVHSSGSWNCPNAVTVVAGLTFSSAAGTVEFSGGITAPSISGTTSALATLTGAVTTGNLSLTGASANVNIHGTNTIGGNFTASNNILNLNAAVINVAGASCNLNPTTLTAGTSQIKFNGSGAQTFTTNGKTYATVWNNKSGGGSLVFVGHGATFGTFRSDSGQTTTFTSGQTFNIASANATGGIFRSTSAAQYTWNNTSGAAITIPNANVQYCNGTGTGGWRTTGAWTDAGNNTGWIFVRSSGFFLFF